MKVEYSDVGNFELKGATVLDKVLYGTVIKTTTSGILFWKKIEIEQVKICREYVGNWHFVETGEFTPGHVIEDLVRSYEARNRVNLFKV